MTRPVFLVYCTGTARALGRPAASQIGGFGVRRAATHLGAYGQVHIRGLTEAAEVVLEHGRARRPLEPRLLGLGLGLGLGLEWF